MLKGGFQNSIMPKIFQQTRSFQTNINLYLQTTPKIFFQCFYIIQQSPVLFKPFRLIIPPLGFLQELDCFVIITIANDFGRYATYNCIRRNIFCNHSIGKDYRSIVYLYPTN